MLDMIAWCCSQVSYGSFLICGDATYREQWICVTLNFSHSAWCYIGREDVETAQKVSNDTWRWANAKETSHFGLPPHIWGKSTVVGIFWSRWLMRRFVTFHNGRGSDSTFTRVCSGCLSWIGTNAHSRYRSAELATFLAWIMTHEFNPLWLILSGWNVIMDRTPIQTVLVKCSNVANCSQFCQQFENIITFILNYVLCVSFILLLCWAWSHGDRSEH